MSIKYAILGFLSWRAFTGYELKKVFAESATLGWSGNSNQIYTTLVELHREELVSLEIQLQTTHPARKLYSVTEKGLAELKSWVLAIPEPPLQKNPFLLQLAWADQLNAEEFDAMLETYTEKLQTALAIFRVKDQRKVAPQRSQREAAFWRMIAANWVAFYEHELSWVETVRTELAQIKKEQGGHNI